jgi:hypothetical protein
MASRLGWRSVAECVFWSWVRRKDDWDAVRGVMDSSAAVGGGLLGWGILGLAEVTGQARLDLALAAGRRVPAADGDPVTIGR